MHPQRRLQYLEAIVDAWQEPGEKFGCFPLWLLDQVGAPLSDARQRRPRGSDLPQQVLTFLVGPAGHGQPSVHLLGGHLDRGTL